MLNSFDTTVATPRKWIGLVFPHKTLVILPVTSTQVISSLGYISLGDGAKTMSPPAFSTTFKSLSNVLGYASKSSDGPNWVGFTKTLTTVMSFSLALVEIKEAWPWCNAPIVGTRPTVFPWAFKGLMISLNSFTEWTHCTIFISLINLSKPYTQQSLS